MKSLAWKLLLVLGLAGPLSAALVDFSFRYDRVELKNGRRLQDVTFKSYDTLTKKVGAVAGRQVMTLRLGDLPDDIVAKIKERIPEQTEAEIKEEKKQAAEDLREAKRRARELEKRAVAETKADRSAQRRLDVKRAEAAIDEESRVKTTVAAAAKELAYHYFKYEADPHSNVGYVFDSNIILEDPEPIPGWTNHWRVRGKVGVQYLTNNLGSVSRKTKEFELRIEAPPKGKPKLLDVTISRM